MRIFIAIELPARIKSIPSHIKGELEVEEDNIKWVSTRNIHLTIKFLGECPKEDISEIADDLRQALSNCRSFWCKTREIGAFPNARRVKVLWLGVDKKFELRTIQQKINAALVGRGLKDEEKAFTPHITLARTRTAKAIDIERLNSKIKVDHLEDRFKVTHVTLFSSHLSPKGAEHKVLARINFPTRD